MEDWLIIRSNHRGTSRREKFLRSLWSSLIDKAFDSRGKHVKYRAVTFPRSYIGVVVRSLGRTPAFPSGHKNLRERAKPLKHVHCWPTLLVNAVGQNGMRPAPRTPRSRFFPGSKPISRTRLLACRSSTTLALRRFIPICTFPYHFFDQGGIIDGVIEI